jgi:hypothetical protein
MPRPKYDMLIRHGKTAQQIAEKMRADPAVRTDALNEIAILEERNRGRIIDRCVTSKEYRDILRDAVELADAPARPPGA